MSDSNTTPQTDLQASAAGATPSSAKLSGAGGGGSRFEPTWQVFLGLLTAYLGLGMVVPVMAPLIRELGLTEFQGGLIFAVNYLMWVMASPVWGGRADVWGRKPIIILGLVGFSVGHVLFGLVADFGLWGWMAGMPLLFVLMGTRALAGFLFSATPPAAQAYIVDRTSDHERTKAVALLGAAAGIGSVLGPGLIWGMSQFESVSLATPLYVAAALPILPTIALWIFLPSEKAAKRVQAPPVLWAWDKRIAAVLLVGLILNIAIALLLFTLGFYFQDRLHLNEYETTRSSSMAMLIVGIVAVVVQVGLLRVLTWSPVTLLRVGMSIMAVGTGLLVFSGTELTIDVSVAIIGMGYAFAYPGFQAAISFAVGPKEQGAVAGLAAATGAVAFIIGPVVGTLIYQWEPVAPYIASACVLLVGAVIAMVHPRLKAIRKVSKGVVTVDGSVHDQSLHVPSELFSDVLANVERATLPADRFALLAELSQRHHFTSEQIRELMLLFTFGKDRVEVAAMLHSGVRDPENFYIVRKALTFDSEKASLQERVGGDWPKG